MSLIDNALAGDGLFTRKAVRTMAVANTLEKERLRVTCRHLEREMENVETEYEHSRAELNRRMENLDRAANGKNKDILIVKKKPSTDHEQNVTREGPRTGRKSTAEIVLKRDQKGTWKIIKSVRNSNDFVRYLKRRSVFGKPNERLKGYQRNQFTGYKFGDIDDGLEEDGKGFGDEENRSANVALDACDFNALALRLHRTNTSVSNPVHMTSNERKIYSFLKTAVDTGSFQHTGDRKRKNGDMSENDCHDSTRRLWHSTYAASQVRYIGGLHQGHVKVKQRTILLPPIILPPVHAVKPKPLATLMQNQIVATRRRRLRENGCNKMDEDLQFCRYLRSGLAKFRPDENDQNSLYASE